MELIGLAILLLGVSLLLWVFLVRKRKSYDELIEAQFQLAFDEYADGHKSSVLIEELQEKVLLTQLKGFDSVITLLRHRHRGRSLDRLRVLYNDWKMGSQWEDLTSNH